MMWNKRWGTRAQLTLLMIGALAIGPAMAADPTTTESAPAGQNQEISGTKTADLGIGFGLGTGFGRGWGPSWGSPWGWGPGWGSGFGFGVGTGNPYRYRRGTYSNLNIWAPSNYFYSRRQRTDVAPLRRTNQPGYYTDGSVNYSSADFYRNGGFTQANPVPPEINTGFSAPLSPEQPSRPNTPP